MSQLKIYTKWKITSRKQNLEHKCVIQESCKTVRRWQRSIPLVNGGHCVGDCSFFFFVLVILVSLFYPTFVILF